MEKQTSTFVKTVQRAKDMRINSYGGKLPHAYRLFHGPGEPLAAQTAPTAFTEGLLIDVFEKEAWISSAHVLTPVQLRDLEASLQSVGITGAVLIERSNSGPPRGLKPLFGKVPASESVVEEGSAKYGIRWKNVFQPGLFLDHEPLRMVLQEGSIFRSMVRPRILNTFCFTGSLSVSAYLGAVKQGKPDATVTSIDLSRPVLDWAKANWQLNSLPADSARWIHGDVFDRLGTFRKKGELFDLILLDPPSFSRGPRGVFSTAKDLERLLSDALPLLSREGWLMLSINTSKILPKVFRSRVETALAKLKWRIINEIQLPLPPGVPVVKGKPETQILKSIFIKLDRTTPAR